MVKRHRILFIHHFSGLGGATMSLFYLIEKLDSLIFDIEVLFLGGEGAGVVYFRQHGIKVRVMMEHRVYPHAYGADLSFIGRKPWLPITRLFYQNVLAKRLNHFFCTEKYDLVHLNTSLLLAYGKAAKHSGSKVVWHIRESLHPGLFGVRRFFVRRWIRKYSDIIFTISGFEKEALGNPKQAQVVYNYVDFKKFDRRITGEPLRKEWNIAPNDFVVINMGGAVHSKGGDLFIKAAALLAKKYSDIKFVLLGMVNVSTEDNWRSRLKRALGMKQDRSIEIVRQIKLLQLDPWVIIAGVRTDVPQVLAASNLLVWSATVRHFARPIIEAAAMGKPVIAADFPNTQEALIDQVTGLVFEPGDEHDLAKKIEWLYLHRELAGGMGTKGFELAHRKFNSEINFRVIISAYNQLLKADEA